MVVVKEKNTIARARIIFMINIELFVDVFYKMTEEFVEVLGKYQSMRSFI
jgi:hypothetical protein